MKSPDLQPIEQLLYARWIDWGARVGLAVLVMLFAVYGAGIVEPLVSHDRLPALWTLPVERYVAETGVPIGWHWLAQAHRADVANLVGIAMLTGCSLLAVLAVLPLYARRGDRALVWIGIAEIAVLVLAASGMLTSGH